MIGFFLNNVRQNNMNCPNLEIRDLCWGDRYPSSVTNKNGCTH